MEQQKRMAAYDEMTFNAGIVECETTLWEGTAANELAFSSITMPIITGNCGMQGKAGSVTVEINKCNYVFYSGEKDANENLEGAIEIECKDPSESINYKYVVGGFTKCIIQLPPQTALTKVTYKNEGAGKLRVIHVDINISNGIKYTQVAGTGSEKCSAETVETGSWVGTELLKGVDSMGAQVGIWVQ